MTGVQTCALPIWLRDLPGLYVYSLERSGQVLSPVSPEEQIQINDILCFSGIVSTIVDAQKIRGLEPIEHHSATSSQGEPDAPRAAPRAGNLLCEVVMSPSSPLIGMTVKETDFRSRYQASIVAVHRSGEKLEQKIGQITLQSGDTLLVDAPDDFAKRWRNSRDFILVSGLEDSAPVEHRRAWLALTIFAGVVIGMTAFTEQATLVALIGAALTVLTGCLPAREAQRSIDIPVLLLIAAALGVSKALDTSGAAEWIAGHLLSWAQPFGKIAVLAVIVLLTGLLTELLSNNACAALMATLALATAKQLGMDPRPLLIAVPNELTREVLQSKIAPAFIGGTTGVFLGRLEPGAFMRELGEKVRDAQIGRQFRALDRRRHGVDKTGNNPAGCIRSHRADDARPISHDFSPITCGEECR